MWATKWGYGGPIRVSVPETTFSRKYSQAKADEMERKAREYYRRGKMSGGRKHTRKKSVTEKSIVPTSSRTVGAGLDIQKWLGKMGIEFH